MCYLQWFRGNRATILTTPEYALATPELVASFLLCVVGGGGSRIPVGTAVEGSLLGEAVHPAHTCLDLCDRPPDH